jgi:hypothetical protein
LEPTTWALDAGCRLLRRECRFALLSCLQVPRSLPLRTSLDVKPQSLSILEPMPKWRGVYQPSESATITKHHVPNWHIRSHLHLATEHSSPHRLDPYLSEFTRYSLCQLRNCGLAQEMPHSLARTQSWHPAHQLSSSALAVPRERHSASRGSRQMVRSTVCF